VAGEEKADRHAGEQAEETHARSLPGNR